MATKKEDKKKLTEQQLSNKFAGIMWQIGKLIVNNQNELKKIKLSDKHKAKPFLDFIKKFKLESFNTNITFDYDIKSDKESLQGDLLLTDDTSLGDTLDIDESPDKPNLSNTDKANFILALIYDKKLVGKLTSKISDQINKLAPHLKSTANNMSSPSNDNLNNLIINGIKEKTRTKKKAKPSIGKAKNNTKGSRALEVKELKAILSAIKSLDKKHLAIYFSEAEIKQIKSNENYFSTIDIITKLTHIQLSKEKEYSNIKTKINSLFVKLINEEVTIKSERYKSIFKEIYKRIKKGKEIAESLEKAKNSKEVRQGKQPSIAPDSVSGIIVEPKLAAKMPIMLVINFNKLITLLESLAKQDNNPLEEFLTKETIDKIKKDNKSWIDEVHYTKIYKIIKGIKSSKKPLPKKIIKTFDAIKSSIIDISQNKDLIMVRSLPIIKSMYTRASNCNQIFKIMLRNFEAIQAKAEISNTIKRKAGNIFPLFSSQAIKEKANAQNEIKVAAEVAKLNKDCNLSKSDIEKLKENKFIKVMNTPELVKKLIEFNSSSNILSARDANDITRRLKEGLIYKDNLDKHLSPLINRATIDDLISKKDLLKKHLGILINKKQKLIEKYFENIESARAFAAGKTNNQKMNICFARLLLDDGFVSDDENIQVSSKRHESSQSIRKKLLDRLGNIDIIGLKKKVAEEGNREFSKELEPIAIIHEVRENNKQIKLAIKDLTNLTEESEKIDISNEKSKSFLFRQAAIIAQHLAILNERAFPVKQSFTLATKYDQTLLNNQDISLEIKNDIKHQESEINGTLSLLSKINGVKITLDNLAKHVNFLSIKHSVQVKKLLKHRFLYLSYKANLNLREKYNKITRKIADSLNHTNKIRGKGKEKEIDKIKSIQELIKAKKGLDEVISGLYNNNEIFALSEKTKDNITKSFTIDFNVDLKQLNENIDNKEQKIDSLEKNIRELLDKISKELLKNKGLKESKKSKENEGLKEIKESKKNEELIKKEEITFDNLSKKINEIAKHASLQDIEKLLNHTYELNTYKAQLSILKKLKILKKAEAENNTARASVVTPQADRKKSQEGLKLSEMTEEEFEQLSAEAMIKKIGDAWKHVQLTEKQYKRIALAHKTAEAEFLIIKENIDIIKKDKTKFIKDISATLNYNLKSFNHAEKLKGEITKKIVKLVTEFAESAAKAGSERKSDYKGVLDIAKCKLKKDILGLVINPTKDAIKKNIAETMSRLKEDLAKNSKKKNEIMEAIKQGIAETMPRLKGDLAKNVKKKNKIIELFKKEIEITIKNNFTFLSEDGKRYLNNQISNMLALETSSIARGKQIKISEVDNKISEVANKIYKVIDNMNNRYFKNTKQTTNSINSYVEKLTKETPEDLIKLRKASAELRVSIDNLLKLRAENYRFRYIYTKQKNSFFTMLRFVLWRKTRNFFRNLTKRFYRQGRIFKLPVYDGVEPKLANFQKQLEKVKYDLGNDTLKYKEELGSYEKYLKKVKFMVKYDIGKVDPKEFTQNESNNKAFIFISNMRKHKEKGKTGTNGKKAHSTTKRNS